MKSNFSNTKSIKSPFALLKKKFPQLLTLFFYPTCLILHPPTCVRANINEKRGWSFLKKINSIWEQGKKFLNEINTLWKMIRENNFEVFLEVLKRFSRELQVVRCIRFNHTWELPTEKQQKNKYLDFWTESF